MSSITGQVNGITNPSFSYDSNGNLTSGAGRSVTWTAFNRVHEITQGTTVIDYAYDAEHKRIKQAVSGGETTYYLSGLASGGVEETVISGATTTFKTYLQADGQLVAQRSAVVSAPRPSFWTAPAP